MLTIDQIKNNLRIDHNMDDEYLTMLQETAVSFLMGAIEVKDQPTDPRFDIATMFLIAHWYENREGVNGSQLSEIPFGVTALIHQLRGLPHPEEFDNYVL